jgi:hypothetical protein
MPGEQGNNYLRKKYVFIAIIIRVELSLVLN